MQNGVIYFPNSTNIGDDIQTYAASLLIDNPVFCNFLLVELLRRVLFHHRS